MGAQGQRGVASLAILSRGRYEEEGSMSGDRRSINQRERERGMSMSWGWGRKKIGKWAGVVRRND